MANNFESKNLNETTIPNDFTIMLEERWCMTWPQDRTPEFYRVLFNSIATMLKYNRSKNNPRIGFKLINDAGEFRLGAILDYQKSDGEAEDTGNWVLSFTFYEEDMKDLNACFDNMSDSFFTIMDREIFDTMNGHFVTNEAASNMAVASIEVLKKDLSDMSNSGKEIEVVHPGVFVASVGFEEGQKVFSIVPGHNVKQIVKDDKGLAK